jgi:hypothetical protein
VPKTKKTAGELEAMVLELVPKERRCEEVQGVTVARDTRGVGWTVSHYRLGNAGEFPFKEALEKVLPRLQREFDLQN